MSHQMSLPEYQRVVDLNGPLNDPTKSILKKLSKYYLVQFVQRGREPKTRPMDVVNGNWLWFDTKSKKIKTQYPSDPKNDTSYQTRLNQLLPADPHWPSYTVKLRGKSDNLPDALEKLEALRTKKSTLTHSSGDDTEAAEQQEIELVQKTKLLEGAAKFLSKISSESKGRKQNTKGVTTASSKSAVASPKVNATTTNICDDNVGSSKLHQLASKSTISKSSEHSPSIIKSSIKPSPLSADSSCQENANQTELSKEMSPVLHGQNQNTPSLQHKTTLDSNKVLMKGHQKDKACPQDGKSYNKSKSLKRSSSFAFEDSLSSKSRKRSRQDFSQVLEQLDLIDNNMVKLTKMVNDNTEELKTIKAMLVKNSTNIPEDFVGNSKALAKKYEKYEFTIPINSLDHFEKFEKSLKEKEELATDLKEVLKCKLTKCLSVSKCLVGMFKMILTRNAAINFTATKKVTGKITMIDTRFYAVVEGLIKEHRALASLKNFDEDFRQKLSDVVTNVKKWPVEDSILDACSSGSNKTVDEENDDLSSSVEPSLRGRGGDDLNKKGEHHFSFNDKTESPLSKSVTEDGDFQDDDRTENSDAIADDPLAIHSDGNVSHDSLLFQSETDDEDDDISLPDLPVGGIGNDFDDSSSE